MQAQLFEIDNVAYVQRSTDRNAQDLAKVARLEAQLIREQKARALAEKSRDELNALLAAQTDRINALLAIVKNLQQPPV